MTSFLVPIIFLPLGVVFVIWSEQAGIAFCRLGKSIWRISTFGLTDMHWFYREDKVSGKARRIGIVFILVGLVFSVIAGLSFFGPNSFAAMREASDYLTNKYGHSDGGLRMSVHAEGQNSNVEIVGYHYANHDGHLRAVWTGDKYVFSEE